MLKNKIKKLIDLIENTQIEEIEVSSFWGAQKIKLSKSNSSKNIPVPVQMPSEEIKNQNIVLDDNKTIENDYVDVSKNKNNDTVVKEEEYEETYSDKTKFEIITAPLVGTFYSSSKPEEPAFVNIGDRVVKGTTLCIIEAMKIFNEIDSEINGELVEIYVKDGSPIEYGQELFVLRIDDV